MSPESTRAGETLISVHDDPRKNGGPMIEPLAKQAIAKRPSRTWGYLPAVPRMAPRAGSLTPIGWMPDR
jgi:hypothetical protein